MASRLFIIAIGAAALVAILAGTALGGLRPNPANLTQLLSQPIDDERYDYAEDCRKKVPSGTRALQRWFEENVRGESWGITRCEALGDGYSVHSEGRAIDWRLDAGIKKERKAAKRLIRTLLKTDANGNPHALARRMGVQGLIFNCRQWFVGSKKLGPYSACYRKNGEKRTGVNRTLAHRDHVHIELNWPGAREQTSFWESGLAN
jgi:hypothetical protein